MEYRCNTQQCEISHSTHCGQVVFFDRDKRSNSTSFEKEVLKIRLLISHDSYIDNLPSTFEQVANEYLLIEDNIEEILLASIINRRSDIAFFRNRTSTTIFVINQIFNVSRECLRFSNLLSSMRGELEIKAFDREYLIKLLNEDVRSFSLLIFVDEFDLYRNVYHSVTDIYAMPASLCARERQKSNNVIIIVLDPHEAEFNDILNCLHIDLKNMNRDCVLNINDQETVA